MVKKVIIRSGGAENLFNIRIFKGLIKELRIRLDITKDEDGLTPDKIQRKIDFGLELDPTASSNNQDEAHERDLAREQEIQAIR